MAQMLWINKETTYSHDIECHLGKHDPMKARIETEDKICVASAVTSKGIAILPN
jgi:hypothetical protein